MAHARSRLLAYTLGIISHNKAIRFSRNTNQAAACDVNSRHPFWVSHHRNRALLYAFSSRNTSLKLIQFSVIYPLQRAFLQKSPKRGHRLCPKNLSLRAFGAPRYKTLDPFLPSDAQLSQSLFFTGYKLYYLHLESSFMKSNTAASAILLCALLLPFSSLLVAQEVIFYDEFAVKSIEYPKLAGNKVFFLSDTNKYGRELWVADLPLGSSRTFPPSHTCFSVTFIPTYRLLFYFCLCIRRGSPSERHFPWHSPWHLPDLPVTAILDFFGTAIFYGQLR